MPEGAGLVQVESEMSKLLPFEDQINKFREAIEKVVGDQVTDEALLQALSAVKTDITTLNSKLSTCQTNLTTANKKVWKTLTLGNYLIKIYKV